MKERPIRLAPALVVALVNSSVLLSRSSPFGDPDKMFVLQAARDSLTASALHTIALRRAQSPQTRAVARQLLTDDQRRRKELEQLAHSEGVTVSSTPDDGQRELALRLRELPPDRFDREYAAIVASESAQLQSRLEHIVSAGSDPQIHAYAISELPTIRNRASFPRDLAALLAAHD